uniref:Uncharacterized protein n=1 Tax=Romanomermis culicivorax TaxID=13658 RepID=A0A915KSL3_ROMCU
MQISITNRDGQAVIYKTSANNKTLDGHSSFSCGEKVSNKRQTNTIKLAERLGQKRTDKQNGTFGETEDL